MRRISNTPTESAQDFEEKVCLCALNKYFGYKPKIALSLLAHFGKASEIFRLSEDERDLLFGTDSSYRNALNQGSLDQAKAEIERLDKEGITFIGWSENCYPALLKDCDDPPIGLYVRSSESASSLFCPQKRIAIVGTRDISPYGKEWCIKTVDALASCKEKPMIVSGLAYGTDITAHKRALDKGLPTIAVMATGIDRIYPYRHKDIAEQIATAPGSALITDYPPGTAPLATHFLRRNRIIAGLSDATILIESRIRGGGMMTAGLSFSYSRDTYALPGRVDDPCSQGCNSLIRKKIAEAYTGTKELMESLGLNPLPTPETASRNDWPADRTGLMSEILLLIKKERGITIDDIAYTLGTEVRHISEAVGILESEGFICTDILRRCSINIKR